MSPSFTAGWVSAGALLAIGLAWSATVLIPEREVARETKPQAPIVIDTHTVSDAVALEQGRAYYAQVCMDCHGASGNGYGEWAYRVSPRPTNLTATRTQSRSDETLFQIISDGLPATAMIAWKRHLSVSQRHQLVAYLRYLGKTAQPKAAS